METAKPIEFSTTRFNQTWNSIQTTASPHVQQAFVNFIPNSSPRELRNVLNPVAKSPAYYEGQIHGREGKLGSIGDNDEFDFELHTPRNRISLSRLEFERSLLEN